MKDDKVVDVKSEMGGSVIRWTKCGDQQVKFMNFFAREIICKL